MKLGRELVIKSVVKLVIKLIELVIKLAKLVIKLVELVIKLAKLVIKSVGELLRQLNSDWRGRKLRYASLPIMKPVTKALWQVGYSNSLGINRCKPRPAQVGEER